MSTENLTRLCVYYKKIGMSVPLHKLVSISEGKHNVLLVQSNYRHMHCTSIADKCAIRKSPVAQKW
jgi:hypothetical protein